MNRLFKKNYIKFQSKTKQVLTEFYEESIWYLHQPQSLIFRYCVLFGSVYCFSCWWKGYQHYYGDVLKRKTLRRLEIENANLPIQSKEEHILQQKRQQILSLR